MQPYDCSSYITSHVQSCHCGSSYQDTTSILQTRAKCEDLHDVQTPKLHSLHSSNCTSRMKPSDRLRTSLLSLHESNQPRCCHRPLMPRRACVISALDHATAATPLIPIVSVSQNSLLMQIYRPNTLKGRTAFEQRNYNKNTRRKEAQEHRERIRKVSTE